MLQVTDWRVMLRFEWLCSLSPAARLSDLIFSVDLIAHRGNFETFLVATERHGQIMQSYVLSED